MLLLVEHSMFMSKALVKPVKTQQNSYLNIFKRVIKLKEPLKKIGNDIMTKHYAETAVLQRRGQALPYAR